jgi:hypothetical protein
MNYGSAALERECARLASAGQDRNSTLNAAAFALGQLVGSGELERDAVEEGLLKAATSNGYVAKDGLAAARATIKSGLNKGLVTPREAPQRPSDCEAGRPAAPASKAGSPYPEWTLPLDGKPSFHGIGAAEPESRGTELRRHVYRRAREPVRVKVKRRDGGFVDIYRVRRPSDGAIGWQAKRPAAYVPVAYTGPLGAADPFAGDHVADLLLWPEGENDVDTLQRAGLLAFTFGGSNDVPAECERLVEGRDVVILTDNDQAGRKCGERKAALAATAAARVRVVHFADLPEHADVSDFLAERAADDLAARIEATPDWTPLSGTRPVLSAINIGAWFDTEPPPLRFAAEPVIPRGMVTLLSGDGGSGKTILAQQAMTCIAAGQPFLGLSVAPGAAAGIFGEDATDILHRRQRRICEHMGLVPNRQLIERLRPASFLGVDMALWRHGSPTEFFRDLERDLTRIADLLLVVIDCASLAYADNENDRASVTSFLASLNGLAHRLGAAILLIGHTSKTQSDEAARMASGSTQWVWGTRSALRLKFKDGKSILSQPKANHAKRIEPVELSWTDEGVLAFDSAVAGTSSWPDKEICRAILRAIEEAWDAARPWSPHVQAKRSGTYAPERIARQFSIAAGLANIMVQTWMNNDVLTLEVIEARSNRHGLKVVGSIG